jgi:hypothetical protein
MVSARLFDFRAKMRAAYRIGDAQSALGAVAAQQLPIL